MSNFIKYPSIENSYQKKVIDFFTNIFPDLTRCKYTIESKIDGCNVAAVIKQNSEILYHSRNQLIGDINSFHGLGTTMQKYGDELEKFVKIARDLKSTCTIYFEYAGNGIQGRVNYGPEKFIRNFTFRLNDEIKSPQFLYDLSDKYDLNHILIPVLDIVDGLEAALEYDPVYVNKIYPEGQSYEEGIVIKPLNKVYKTNNGDIFLLKKKNAAFSEKSKKVKEKNVITDECSEIISEFTSYVNESRIYSIFSKEGRKISDKSEIGYFIKLVIEDVLTDYFKENDAIEDEKCLHLAKASASKKCAQLLMTFL